MLEKQGIWICSSLLYQTDQAFKLQGSVNNQVQFSECVSSIVPEPKSRSRPVLGPVSTNSISGTVVALEPRHGHVDSTLHGNTISSRVVATVESRNDPVGS